MSPHLATETPIQLRRWTVTSGSNVNSRAAVVLVAGDHTWDASSEGRGAVDALYRAVDRALADVLDGHPRLVAYDVHALAEGPSAEGRVTVAIAPPAGAAGERAEGRFAGEVTSANIIAASLEAYVTAINAMLRDDAWEGAAREAGDRRGRRPGDGSTAASDAEWIDAEPDVDPTDWFNR